MKILPSLIFIALSLSSCTFAKALAEEDVRFTENYIEKKIIP